MTRRLRSETGGQRQMTGRRSWLRRTASHHLISPLPRVAAGRGWRALAVNLIVLLLSSAICAGVLHVAAYHLPWERASGYLLAHCPLRPFLLLAKGEAHAGLSQWGPASQAFHQALALARQRGDAEQEATLLTRLSMITNKDEKGATAN